MAEPEASDVIAFLGKDVNDTPEDLTAKVGHHLPIVTMQVEAYVRGNGFTDGEPSDDLAAVIVSACARSVVNPEVKQSTDTSIDDARFATRYGVFNGWTLPELAILHRYRKRAL